MIRGALASSHQFGRALTKFVSTLVLTRRAVEPASGIVLPTFTRGNFFTRCKFQILSDVKTRYLYCSKKVLRPFVLSHLFKLNLGGSEMSSFPFCADYDKRGAAKCKKCKEKCEKGALRIGKIVPNPFSESGGEMKQWHHVDCIFDVFKRARATTKKIEDPIEDIDGWEEVEDDDKKKIRALIEDLQDTVSQKKNTPKKQTPQKKNTPKQQTPQKKAGQQKLSNSEIQKKFKHTLAATQDPSPSETPSPTNIDPGMDRTHKDNSFREFRRICANIAGESSYLGKTEILSNFFKYGTNKSEFQGDLRLWVKLLLPGVIKRVYNLQSRQLIKLFSQIFGTNQEEMMEDLEQGDVAETVCKFFEQSTIIPPIKKSLLSIQEVNELLEELEGKTRDEEQSMVLKKGAKKCTGNDLKMLVRLIKADLRINAGAKHILDAVHSDAYEAFQTTRNIDAVLDQILLASSSDVNFKMTAQVMTPVLPMLAEACKSVDYAFKKCPSGAMFAEIKYDGERVQVHQKGNKFSYFSRSLKPVMPHKVSHFKEYIPKAFPHGKDLILDSEVLLIDTRTGNPLPFGTLGVHKKAEFQDASVCLFVFDCIHYNGEDLMNKPLKERRKILEENMNEIENHIMFSEMKMINKKEDLRDMINRVLKQGLEGLVLKDINSIYEPGKRHWLKIKKDYLNDGAMADTADLVILGAWYGTGKKGGMMSVFLMGCYDPRINKWCTVTKVHTGIDDARLEQLQTELDMMKISQDADRVPIWLKCNKSMVPDFVAADPKASPVWEITGAEFTCHQIHTADGISIRFPRVTRERNDKTWEQATSLAELQTLYKNSREALDFEALASDSADRTDEDDGSKKSGGSGSSTPVKPPTGVGSTSSGSPSASSPNKRSTEKNKNKAQKSLSGFLKVENMKQEDKTEDQKRKDREKYEKKEGKRKSDESLEDTPVKKACRYGADCHNENEAHLYLYEHPSRICLKPPTINPLPDVFHGVHVSIPHVIEKSDVLKRYIIARKWEHDGTTFEHYNMTHRYDCLFIIPKGRTIVLKGRAAMFNGRIVVLKEYGGDVLPEYRAHDATHLIVMSKDMTSPASCKGKRVMVGWLWDSIKLQKLQPTRLYIS